MASTTFYPPIVKDYEPAFIAGQNAELKIYFNLSSLSGTLPEGWNIQAQIIRKDGVQVVNIENNPSNNRYRATGTILNINPSVVNPSLGYYYITLTNDDLKSVVDIGGTTFSGFIPGWTYKVQLRISTVAYDGSSSQEAWLQQNSINFTEWSTICFVKAISSMNVTNFNFVDGDPSCPNNSSIEFKGSIFSSVPEVEEDYYSCRVYLYEINDDNSFNLIEDSGLIFNDEISNSYYGYTFKSNLVDGQKYRAVLTYTTENDYVGENKIYYFTHTEGGDPALLLVHLATLENDPLHIVGGKTSLGIEEDEGRIGLKLYYNNNVPQGQTGVETSTYYIRRADSRTNFTVWDDIYKIVNLSTVEADINATEVFYDYTIESGIWYKYAIQAVVDGGRTVQEVISTPVIRIFNFSYLLGLGGRQLKLEFDNTLGNFSPRVIDSKNETIGSKYPFFGRNSKVDYNTFALNGLISFNMDEQNTFLQEGKKSIYQFDNIVTLYNNYNINRSISQYDYTYEREFRKEVLKFLKSGNLFLYKSPTEGNMIIRLTDISCTPNQSLDRMIYSFSGNASEADDYTVYNCLKYGLFVLDKELKENEDIHISHSHTLDIDTPQY